MKKLSKIKNALYWLLLSVVVFVAGLSLLTLFLLPNRLRMFVVESGSMAPAIQPGSVILTQKESNYSKGDIISFKVQPNADLKNPKAIISHRIIEVKTSTVSGTVFITKGDANNIQDMEPRPLGNVLGKVIFSIPYLGYPVNFAKTQTGFILLIVIPATLIVYTEILNIKNEAKRLIAERKKRKLTAFETVEEKAGEEIIAAEKAVKKAVKNSKK